MMRLPIGLAALCLTFSAFGAEPFDDKFRQLDELIPSGNAVRNASGAPGHAYWQQRADYSIRATLDEANRAISASEIPASSGVPGPGEITIASGAIASTSSGVSASLRCVLTSAPSSPKYCTRL